MYRMRTCFSENNQSFNISVVIRYKTKKLKQREKSVFKSYTLIR